MREDHQTGPGRTPLSSSGSSGDGNGAQPSAASLLQVACAFWGHVVT
jgi:hypothetical protein